MNGSAGAGHPPRVLFVCTGNSARSIMAEALLRHHVGPGFEVYSAGTHPKGVNPLTLRALGEVGVQTAGLASKSVGQFVGDDFDLVITVCDQAREACPVLPGARRTEHWNHDDPAAVEGTDEERMSAFRAVRDRLAEQVAALVGELSPAHQ